MLKPSSGLRDTVVIVLIGINDIDYWHNDLRAQLWDVVLGNGCSDLLR